MAEVSKPQPNPGQITPFGPRPGKGPRRTGGSGAPSFQEFMNPNLHNTHGLTSNPTVSYPFLTRPFKSVSAHPLEGEMMFTVRQAASKAGSGFLITAMPLSYLNTKLYECAGNLAAEQLVSTNTLNSKLQKVNKGTATFYEHLNFLGVMRNEAISPSRHQKLINVDVRGRTRIRNVWRGDIRTGEKLYLQLDIVSVVNYGHARPDRRQPPNDSRVFKLTPKTGTELYNTASAKSAAESQSGRTHIGCLFIGVAMNTVHKASSDDKIMAASVRPKTIKTLDFIEVALKVTR